MNLTNHWNKTYQSTDVDQLGWFESSPEPTLALIDRIHLPKQSRILTVGVGASTLVDALLDRGFEGVIANDLSAEGLEKLKQRLGSRSDKVDWIIDDLTRPNTLSNIEPIDLWQDRAVLHFFTRQEDQDQYFNLLNQLLKPGGYAIIATFSSDGAPKCSGLPVQRYDHQTLQEKLGAGFKLLHHEYLVYTQPSGSPRPFIYTLFQKTLIT